MKRLMICLVIGLVVSCYNSDEKCYISTGVEYKYNEYDFNNILIEDRVIILNEDQLQKINNGEIVYLRVFNKNLRLGGKWFEATTTNMGTNYCLAVAFGDGRFVVVGETGSIVYSTNGDTWTAASTPSFGSSNINGIAYGLGKFVAVGESGKIAYSSDGDNWTQVASPPFDTSEVFDIAFGDDRFVAIASTGKTAYSLNGTTWTLSDSPGYPALAELMHICYDDKFVMVEYHGSSDDYEFIRYSNDGVTWTYGDDPNMGNPSGICGKDGVYVIIDEYSRAYYSTDGGDTWVESSSFHNVFDGHSTRGIGCIDGHFIVTGFGFSGYSIDGVSWQGSMRNLASTFDVACGNNIIVAPGTTGKIYFSFY